VYFLKSLEKNEKKVDKNYMVEMILLAINIMGRKALWYLLLKRRKCTYKETRN